MAPTAIKVRPERQDPTPVYRQTMINYKDLQYYGNLTVGNQTFHAVLDTGSIEFVVLSDKCEYWCGDEKRLYHPNRSSTYQKGTTSLVLSYGSGQVMATEAYEKVSVGPITVSTAPFSEVTDANMPLLFDSDFDAIIGLGPIPPATTVLEPGSQKNADSSALLLRKLQIDRYGICLGHESGSEGYFMWNDDSVDQSIYTFSKIPIPNTGYWMALLEDVRLGNTLMACANGCGAVVDSGTSLLALPETSYYDIEKAIANFKTDCSDLSVLPELRFRLGGQPFSLPADAYLGQIFGEVSKSMANNLKSPNRLSALVHTNESESPCEAALMHITMDSSLGAVWILGSPFFRKYYSVFVQGSVDSEPALYTAPATNDCRPTHAAHEVLIGRSVQNRIRKVDASSVRMPLWLHRASSMGRLEEGLSVKGRQVVTNDQPNLHK